MLGSRIGDLPGQMRSDKRYSRVSQLKANTCLTEGVLSNLWKTQRLVLISKRREEEPNCMLDNMNKILERIIHSGLEGSLAEINGLSGMQYGFRKYLSTINDVSKLCYIADKVIEVKRWLYGSKPYCIAATLDVRNAFNSASWHHTFNALSNLNVPIYIQRVVSIYFKDRVLLYETQSTEAVW